MVSGVAATSITTSAFRWLHEEAWEAEQRLAFAVLTESPALGLFAAPAVVRGRRRQPAPSLFGRWLLTLPDGQPLGAAEAQLLQKNFKVLSIVFSPPSAGSSWLESPSQAALTLLVSALMLLSAADQIRLIPLAGGLAGALLPEGAFAGERQLWSPYHSLAKLAGSPLSGRRTSLLLSPQEWWLQAFAAEDRKTLSYLERRVAAAQTTSRPPPRRKRPWWRMW